MFNHIELNLHDLKRKEIDGVRHYVIPESNDELLHFVSITSVISWINRDKFSKWRKKVGDEVADRTMRKAASRGTDMHTLVEHYLKNEDLPKVQPLSELLFKIAKKDLNKIGNIHCLEKALYSKRLMVAGTVDCIAEYNGELAIIDFKTSKKPKPRDWIDHYFVQCAAYACMLYELTGIMVKKFVIIMSCENGECIVYEEYDKAKYIELLGEYLRRFNEK
jgi:ATP-dependent exoDNAse (exonuclease V) beta subunit